MLSAYELQRQQTIANNKAFLATLGLGDGNTLCKEPKEKKKRRAPSAPMPENESPRRSSRVAGRVVDYTNGLTDDYFRLEERKLKRELSKRKRGPVVHILDKHIEELNERRTKRQVLRQHQAHKAPAHTIYPDAPCIPCFEDNSPIQASRPGPVLVGPNVTRTHGHKSQYQCDVCGSREVAHYCKHSWMMGHA